MEGEKGRVDGVVFGGEPSATPSLPSSALACVEAHRNWLSRAERLLRYWHAAVANPRLEKVHF